MIPQLELYDFCLLIIYLFVIYLIAILYVQKKKKENSIYKYFIPALSLKIAGGLVYALYHVYVYKGGDTFGFFDAARSIVDYISILEPSTFGIYVNNYDSSNYDLQTWYSYVLGSKDVFFVAKITSIIYFISLGSYYVITLLFSVFSFIGLWNFFLVFTRLYPLANKLLFGVTFCIPTMLLWSSGLLKDSITIGALGMLVYGVANFFIFNEKRTQSLIIILISFYLIFMLKPYLVYILLPSCFIWIQSNIKAKINSRFIKNLIMPLLLVSIFGAAFLTLNTLSESAGKYSFDNWESTLQGFHSWHGYLAENRDQSGYSLGEMEYTILGVLYKAPVAINVTFFRPYLWEVRNIATLLGALEGVVFLFFTVFIIYKMRFKFIKSLFKNKDVLFLLAFAIPFAFIVGLSSYNFGALSRYKIPAELFYLTALVIMYKQNLTEKR